MANTTPIALLVVVSDELEEPEYLPLRTRVPGLLGDLTDWNATVLAGGSLLAEGHARALI